MLKKKFDIEPLWLHDVLNKRVVDISGLLPKRNVSHVDGPPGGLVIDKVVVVALLGILPALAQVEVVGATHGTEKVVHIIAPLLRRDKKVEEST